MFKVAAIEQWTIAHAMSLLAAVQGIGGLVLGFFTWATIGDAAGTLTTPHLWAAGLAAGGFASLCLAWRRSELSWAVTGAVISTSMLGRGLDILMNLNEFVGRPALAVAIWLTMGASTLAAWAAVGAMAGWAPDDGS